MQGRTCSFTLAPFSGCCDPDPASTAREGVTHTLAVPCPCMLGQDRVGWDEESLLSPGASSDCHPCRLGSVHGSLPKPPLPLPWPPAAIPLGTEPAPGPGTASSPGAAASRAATAMPIQGAVGRACTVSPAALTGGPAQGHHLPCTALLLGHQGNKQHPTAQGLEFQGNGTDSSPASFIAPFTIHA